MRLSSVATFASVCGLTAAGFAANATAPLDVRQRHDAIVPGAPVQPAIRQPASNAAVQDQRVTPPRVSFPAASTPGAERAHLPGAVNAAEQRRAVETQRPSAIERVTSPIDKKPAELTRSPNTVRPELVTRYQESLTAASAANMARFPAAGQVTRTKINRFVFRRNGGAAAVTPDSAAEAVRAGSESAPSR